MDDVVRCLLSTLTGDHPGVVANAGVASDAIVVAVGHPRPAFRDAVVAALQDRIGASRAT